MSTPWPHPGLMYVYVHTSSSPIMVYSPASPAVIVEVESSGLVVREGSEMIVLTCEVYGYPRNSSPPKWSYPQREQETGRFNTTLSNTGLLSVSSTEKEVVSQLTIINVTEADEGEYTCSVDGQSASFYVDLGK